MADNLLVKDANGATRTVKTSEVAGVHTPWHQSVGPLTNSELRAAAVPVSGPLTDTQLRATAVPVQGPVTDTQLRATPLPVAVSGTVPVSITGATIYVPISSGTYSVPPGGTLSAVPIPGGTLVVRIFPAVDVRFRFDALPGTPALGAVAAGGICKAGMWREQACPPSALALYFISTEPFSTGDTTITPIDIEFLGHA